MLVADNRIKTQNITCNEDKQELKNNILTSSDMKINAKNIILTINFVRVMIGGEWESNASVAAC